MNTDNELKLGKTLEATVNINTVLKWINDEILESHESLPWRWDNFLIEQLNIGDIQFEHEVDLKWEGNITVKGSLKETA